jgi:hypothetical protein
MSVSLLLAAGGPAIGAVRAFVPDESNCKPVTPQQTEWLDRKAWEPFQQYVRVCTVRSDPPATAILIVSVWADLYSAGEHAATMSPSFPLPLLFKPDGTRLGELPMNFPTDPPAELVLRFTHWRLALPQEITLCVASPTASGDQLISPLVYQPASGHYIQASAHKANPTVNCHGG